MGIFFSMERWVLNNDKINISIYIYNEKFSLSSAFSEKLDAYKLRELARPYMKKFKWENFISEKSQIFKSRKSISKYLQQSVYNSLCT